MSNWDRKGFLKGVEGVTFRKSRCDGEVHDLVKTEMRITGHGAIREPI
jgi:hypothetical protein